MRTVNQSQQASDGISSGQPTVEAMVPTETIGLFSSFPTTITLIALMHILFLYQWQRRIPRKRIVVTYQALLHSKRFHKLWVALLSHPPIFEITAPVDDSAHEDRPATTTMTPMPGHFFSSSVAMGGPDGDRWISGGERSLQQRIRRLVEWGKWQWKCLTKGELSGLPLLLYISHILWSCRALEQVYNVGDSWRYARGVVAMAVLAVALELSLSQVIIQAIIQRQQQETSGDMLREIQPTLDTTTLDPTFLGQLRQRVQNRTIGTMTTLAAAILVHFQFRYAEIPLAIFPFFTDRFLSRYPTLTYYLCMGILTILARSNHPMGIVTGTLVGLSWVGFSLDFLADAYHGGWFILIIALLTILSLKGQAPYLLPCVEYVSWYDVDAATVWGDSPALRPRSWCFQPLPISEGDEADYYDYDNDNHEENDQVSDGESDTLSVERAHHAWLDFRRLGNNSDNSNPADPDLLEQERRPRRTRIRSRWL